MQTVAASMKMNTAGCVIAVLWILLPCIEASTQCEPTIVPEDSVDKDVCLLKDNKQYLECAWTQRLVLSTILVRECTRNHTLCCVRKRSDAYYDVQGCLARSSISAEQARYSSLIHEVLEQCSQRRYCILENTAGSAVARVRAQKSVDKKVQAGVTVAYSCEHAIGTSSLAMCEKRVVSGQYVYLNDRHLSWHLSCACDIRSTPGTKIHVHVLDVRLRSTSRLDIGNALGDNWKSYDPGTVDFGSVHRFDQQGLNLNFTRRSTAETDNIWIKISAPPASRVTVTCRSSKTTRPVTNGESPVQPQVSRNPRKSPVVFLGVGFGMACALFGVSVFIVVLYRRMKKEDSAHCHSSIHQGEFYLTGKSCGEPLYSQAMLPSDQGSCSTKSPYRDDIDSLHSNYTAAGEMKPVPKPRSMSRQDLTYNSDPRLGARYVSGCSATNEMEPLDVKSKMLREGLQE